MAKPYSIPTHKECTQCKTIKPIEAFSLRLARSKRTPHWHSACKQCKSLASKTYRIAQPIAVRASRQAYHATHRAERNAAKREWARKNRGHISAYNHAWREANPDYDFLYYHLYPEKSAMIIHRRRARKLGLLDTFTCQEEQFCRAYFHYACAACGNEEGFQWQIVMDHFVPLASKDCPGTIATNMIPLCHGISGCNNAKKDKHPQQWLLQRFGPRKAATILRKINAYFAIVRQRFPS